MTARDLRTARVVLAIAAFAFLVFVAQRVRGVDDYFAWRAPVLVVYWLSAGLCLWRAVRVPAERVGWALIGFGLAVWAGGYVVYDALYLHDPTPPYPSVADGLWLTWYVLAYAGLVCIVRLRLGGLGRTFWLEGLLGALGLATIASGVLFSVVSEATDGAASTIATNLAYPLAELLLLGFVTITWWRGGAALGRAWLLLTIALVMETVADVVYLVETVGGTYTTGLWPDVLWPVFALLFAAAAWTRMPDAPVRRERVQGELAFVLPAAYVAVAVAVLVADTFAPINGVARLLAQATLAVALIRVAGMATDLLRLQRAHESGTAELRRRTAAQELLAELGRRTLLEDDLERFAALTAERVVGFLQADAASIFEHAPEGGQLVLLALHHAQDGTTAQAVTVDIPGPDGPRGVLVVRTSSAHGVDPAGWDVLRGAADVLAGRMHRRDAELALQRGQRMESVGQLAGGIAHDFNNLLNVILASAGEIRLAPAGSASRDEDLVTLEGAAHRAAELVRRLLTFARTETGAYVPVDLRALLTGAEPLMRRALAPAARLELDLAQGAEAELRVVADAAQLEQVLLNLCVNAADAMPGGGLVRIALDLVGSPGGPRVRLTVSDTGRGMEEAVRRRAFDPFFTTKGENGTGLGLATVYGIVHASGGRIDVRSVVGVGTSFELTWPQSAAPVAVPRATAPREALAPVRGERVLIVDDEDALRRVLARSLRRAGYEVAEAADGRAALELAGDDDLDLDLVVTDVLMPHMSGTELAAELRTRRPALPVVFMSGYTGETDGGRLEERLLLKPVSGSDLVARVAAELARAPTGAAKTAKGDQEPGSASATPSSGPRDVVIVPRG